MALTFGSKQLFNSNATIPINTFKIDSTHIIVFYLDSSNYGQAKIGTINSDKTISYGSAVSFVSSAVGDCRVVQIDSSNYLIAWTKTANTDNYQYLRIASISGSTISYGTQASYYAYYGTFHNGTTYLHMNSSTSFTVGTYAYGNRWTSGTISGNTISISNESGTTIDPKFKLVCGSYTFNLWNEYLGTPYNEYRGFINTTSYPLVTGGQLNLSTAYSFDYAVLDSNHFVLFYSKSNTAGVFARVITCSSFSIGTEYTVNTTTSSYLSVVALSSTSVVFFYTDSSNWVRWKQGTISGNAISLGSATALATGTSGYIASDAMDSGAIVVAYRDGGNSYRGYSNYASSSTTHELECDISTSATNAFDLDKFQELDVDISGSASATASLDVQSTSMTVAMSGASSMTMTLDRVKELSCDIEGGTSVSAGMEKALGLKVSIQGNSSSSLFLETAPVINLSSVTNFNEAQTETISICALDSNHFVLAYKDYTSDTIKDGRLRIAVKDGSSVEYEPEYVFYSDMASPTTALLALDSTHGLVAYQNSSTQGSVKLFTYNGYYDVPFGSEYTFSDGSQNITQIKLHKVSNTKFVVTFLSANYPKAIVGTISNGVITFGSTTSVSGSYCYSHSGAVLDDTHIAFAYNISGYAYTRIGSIGATSISLIEGPTQFNTGGTDCISQIDVIDSTHYVIAYQDGSNSSRGAVRIVSVSGSTPSLGTEYVFSSDKAWAISVLKKTDNSVSISYRNSTYAGRTVIGFIGAGNSITFSPSKTFASSVETLSATKIDGFQYAVAYNPYVTYANRTTRYGKLIFLDYGNLIPLYLTMYTHGSVANSPSYAIGLRLNSAPSASLAADADITRQLSTSISQTASAGYELYRALGLSAQMEQYAYLTPFLQHARNLQLAIDGFSSATAGLDAIKALATVIEQSSTMEGYLQAQKELSLAIETTQELAARAETHIGLDVDIQSVSSASLSIINLCNLVDAMAATGNVTAGLSLDVLLASVINPHSELYAQAYLELAGSCVIEENADFALTLDHVAQLVGIIETKATTALELELVHLLKAFVEAKANVFVSFNTIIDAVVNMTGQSSLTAEGLVFHGVELICALDAQAQAFFTQDRIAQLVLEVDTNATFISILQNLLRAYLEYKGELYSGLELSGILYDRINFSGKIKYYEIEFIGGLK